jgi:hypothetical protein
MNKGHQPVGVEKALVALEKAQYISNPIATLENVMEDEGEIDEESEEETRKTARLPFGLVSVSR